MITVQIVLDSNMNEKMELVGTLDQLLSVSELGLQRVGDQLYAINVPSIAVFVQNKGKVTEYGSNVPNNQHWVIDVFANKVESFRIHPLNDTVTFKGLDVYAVSLYERTSFKGETDSVVSFSQRF